MKTPPLLLGAALLFWGWQSELLPFAVVMALLLESARFIRARWEFSQADLDRVWNLCTFLLLGVAVYGFTAGAGARSRSEALTDVARPVFQFFQWLPLYFIPIMVVQAWSEHDTMALSTFSWWLRRRRGVVGQTSRLPADGASRRQEAA